MSWLDTPKSEHVVRREHYVSGRDDEREQILELLQAHVCPSCETHYKKYELQSILYVEYPHASCEGLLSAIALIKGENK